MTKETFITLLGALPSHTYSPVSFTIDEAVDHGFFTSSTIHYTDSDNLPIEALLLIPSSLDQSRTHPAVIAYHQHASNFDLGMGEPAGLDGNTENTFALPLLQAGFVVLCVEHIGFGKRRVFKTDGSLIEGRQGERWLFMQELLKGRTLLGRALADLQRGFTILLDLPFIDSSRIGIAGHSMGGMMAFYYGLFEQRIKAVVSSCGIAPMALLQHNRLNHNFSMYLPGFLTHGDTQDLFSVLNPTPLYLTFGAHDPIFPVEGSELLIQSARQAYGDSDILVTEITDDGHGFTQMKQQKSVALLKKWLS